jgi:hypothetical protein
MAFLFLMAGDQAAPPPTTPVVKPARPAKPAPKPVPPRKDGGIKGKAKKP